MIEVNFTSEFQKDLKKLRPNKKLLAFISEKIEVFETEPYHRSLKTHKLKGKLKRFFAFSIKSNLRIIFYWEDANTALCVAIGTHNQVYE